LPVFLFFPRTSPFFSFPAFLGDGSMSHFFFPVRSSADSSSSHRQCTGRHFLLPFGLPFPFPCIYIWSSPFFCRVMQVNALPVNPSLFTRPFIGFFRPMLQERASPFFNPEYPFLLCGVKDLFPAPPVPPPFSPNLFASLFPPFARCHNQLFFFSLWVCFPFSLLLRKRFAKFFFPSLLYRPPKFK